MAVLLVDWDGYSYMTATDQRRAMPYKRHLEGHTISLSFVTVGEQYAGYLKKISQGMWPSKRLGKLEDDLKSVAVIPYDAQVCKTYGEIKSQMELKGCSVAPNDLWIAACAKTHDLVLVTNNRRDFEDIPGLNIISEAP